RRRLLEMSHRGDYNTAKRGRFARSVHGHEVRLLDQDHPAGAKCRRHSLESQAFVGQPLDEPTRVDDVEARGERVSHNVVPQYLKAWVAGRLGFKEVRARSVEQRPTVERPAPTVAGL